MMDEHEKQIALMEAEISRLNGLLDIAYDHLRGAGYEPDGVTLRQLETGCTKTT